MMVKEYKVFSIGNTTPEDDLGNATPENELHPTILFHRITAPKAVHPLPESWMR